MQQTFQEQLPWCHVVAPKPTFKIFIACENQSALFQARRVRDQIEFLCGKDFKVSSVVWSFALFQNEQLRTRATVEAAEAEMIIISLGGGQELPSHVRDWVENWPVRPQPGQAVLVTLVCPEQAAGWQRQHEVHYLREAAASRGLDFLSNHEGWDRVDCFKPSVPILSIVPGRSQSVLSDEMAWSTGGINE